MAKVHFAPYRAIKYTGAKAKEFSGSLARPRPILKKGDIVIVDKKTAFNLTRKGFDNFVEVKDIEFVKADINNIPLVEKLEAFEKHNNELLSNLVDAKAEIVKLKAELKR